MLRLITIFNKSVFAKVNAAVDVAVYDNLSLVMKILPLFAPADKSTLQIANSVKGQSIPTPIPAPSTVFVNVPNSI